MREYKQLTEEDRIEIYAMKQAGKEQNMIAIKLGVHPSTISRKVAQHLIDLIETGSYNAPWAVIL